MKNNYFYIMLLCLFLFSCEEKSDYFSGFTSTIIVEGKIELNGYPKVILTRNIPYYAQIDSADLIKMVLRQAKVTVSDGEKTEILTLKFNSKEFPPYYYQGNELIGKAGKTYYLTIDYGKIQLTATTTIPNPVSLDSVWFKPNSPGDSLGKIYALLQDDPEQHNYYRIYTKIRSKQTEYYPTLISTYDDKFFNGKDYTIQLSKGPESYLDLKNVIYDYTQGDTVYVKIATIEKAVFDFWAGYKNEVVNGANPFASSYHVIKSNIVGDGKGIWAGYGSSVYMVVNK
jgi:hypothetical protein